MACSFAIIVQGEIILLAATQIIFGWEAVLKIYTMPLRRDGHGKGKSTGIAS